MKRLVSDHHPLRAYFREALHTAMFNEVGYSSNDEVMEYLTDLLVEFSHERRIYAIQNAFGQPVRSLAEMLMEGDIRLNAESFDREREVHRHIGDFLLFWSGLFPEMLRQLHGFHVGDPALEAAAQGCYSYQIVSSFDHAPYVLEAPLYKQLSQDFLACQEGLRLVRASFEGFRRQGWDDGFQA